MKNKATILLLSLVASFSLRAMDEQIIQNPLLQLVKKYLKKNQFALHNASFEGKYEKARLLINGGADINAPIPRNLPIDNENLRSKDYEGFRPIDIAIDKGQIDIVKMLIQKGANIHLLKDGFDGRDTTLHTAAQYDNSKIIELLIKSGARVDAVDDNQETPLHIAVRYGNTRAVKFLIKQKPELIYKQNKMGWTPLHIASRYGFDEIVALLISNHADIDILSNDGETSLDVAFVDSNQFNAARRMLIALNAKIDTHDKEFRTLLMRVIRRKSDAELACMLLQRDVNLAASDKKGRTAFHYAAVYKRLDIIKDLLAHIKLNDPAPLLEDSLKHMALATVINNIENFNEASYKFAAENVGLIVEEIYPHIHQLFDLENETVRNFIFQAAPQAVIQHLQDVHFDRIKKFVEDKDINNRTALYYAQRKQNEDIVQVLSAVRAAQSFDKLPEDLKEQIITNIAQKFE